MCDCSSIHLQKIFFLRSIAPQCVHSLSYEFVTKIIAFADYIFSEFYRKRVTKIFQDTIQLNFHSSKSGILYRTLLQVILK